MKIGMKIGVDFDGVFTNLGEFKSEMGRELPPGPYMI